MVGESDGGGEAYLLSQTHSYTCTHTHTATQTHTATHTHTATPTPTRTHTHPTSPLSGVDTQEDLALESQLLADQKERCEHIMLVDLGRNDVGRVAEMGTVSVDKLMEVERYSHVMHISSTVTGKLRPELTSWDALR